MPRAWVDRTLVRHRSRRPDDKAVRARLRELAAVRRRFGWRRLQVLLLCEGLRLNHKKLHRPYARSCSKFATASNASGPW